MADNIPNSVMLTIRAAARDVATSVKGGGNNPARTEKLAHTLEKFMTGIVAQSYPTIKSSWLDGDKDEAWVRGAAEGGMVDGQKLQEAFHIWDKLAPSDRTMLETLNYSKFNGQPLTKLQKENKELYDAYMGPAGEAAPVALPDEGKPLSALPPAAPPPAPKEKPKAKDEIAPPKQELMKPGQVKEHPQEDEFEKGIPTKPLL